MLLASCEHVLAIRPGVVEAVKRLTDALGDDDKSRQLDLLISQDRSVQALMDKTLGVSNVVTEENLSLLWQEMLHPHLEAERQTAREAVNKAKADGKKRLDKATEQLENMRKERENEAAIFDATLETKRLEDRDAVIALGEEVARALRRKRITRIGLGIFLGAMCSIPLLMDTTPMVRAASFLIGWLLAYLTATGGRLLGTGIDEAQALKVLHANAVRRKLLNKLDLFEVQWRRSAFAVSPLPKLSATPFNLTNPGA